MAVEFDPEKSARNQIERGIAFDRVDDFDWPHVLILEDDRKNYGEVRLLMLGYLDGKLHMAVVTPRDHGFRVISLRRASMKEVGLYEREHGSRRRQS